MNYNEVYKEIKAEFPGFDVVVKSASKFMWFLYYCGLMRFWCPTYMTNFTTVFGQTVYMPEYLIGSDSGADVLRHERVHMRDSVKWTVWYWITYVMLPIGPSGRAYWELRGYKETMRCYYERNGNIPDSIIEFVAGQFTTSKYLWMWPFESHIHKILNRYRDEITQPKPLA